MTRERGVAKTLLGHCAGEPVGDVQPDLERRAGDGAGAGRAAQFLNRLLSVSCASARNCVAVGSSLEHPQLSDTWNGRIWRELPSLGAQLFAVACPAAGECVAQLPVSAWLSAITASAHSPRPGTGAAGGWSRRSTRDGSRCAAEASVPAP
jgi:hypothetical protein